MPANNNVLPLDKLSQQAALRRCNLADEQYLEELLEHMASPEDCLSVVTERTPSMYETQLHVAGCTKQSLLILLKHIPADKRLFALLQTNAHGDRVIDNVAEGKPNLLKEIIMLLPVADIDNFFKLCIGDTRKTPLTIMAKKAKADFMWLLTEAVFNAEILKYPNADGSTHFVAKDDEMFNAVLAYYNDDERLQALKITDKFGYSVLHNTAYNVASCITALSTYPKEERIEALLKKNLAGDTPLDFVIQHHLDTKHNHYAVVKILEQVELTEELVERLRYLVNKYWGMKDIDGILEILSSMPKEVVQSKKQVQFILPPAEEKPQVVQYKIHKVIGDGDCGYTAIGITRTEAARLLRDNCLHEKVRNLLHMVVRELFVQDEFHNYLLTKDILLPFTPQNIHNTPDDVLERYSSDLVIINALIAYDIEESKSWVHPAVLVALAVIQNIDLHMWKLDSNKNLQPHRLNEHYDFSHYKPEKITSRSDLLFVNDNHFHRLEFIKAVQKPVQDKLVTVSLPSPGELIMFNKIQNSYELEYDSVPQSKITRIVFSWICGIRLLQVFGKFENQAKLMSFDKGIMSAINICRSNLALSCDKISTEQLDLILNELGIIEPEFRTIKEELRTVIREKTVMFDKKQGNYELEYYSAHPQSKISRIHFSYYGGMRLLQVFGKFGEQTKLMSLHKGILSEMNIGSTHLAISCGKVSQEQLDVILNELEKAEPNFTAIKAELRAVIHEKTGQCKPAEKAVQKLAQINHATISIQPLKAAVIVPSKPAEKAVQKLAQINHATISIQPAKAAVIVPKITKMEIETQTEAVVCLPAKPLLVEAQTQTIWESAPSVQEELVVAVEDNVQDEPVVEVENNVEEERVVTPEYKDLKQGSDTSSSDSRTSSPWIQQQQLSMGFVVVVEDAKVGNFTHDNDSDWDMGEVTETFKPTN